MRRYKETVVADKVTHNGKEYFKGAVVRESIPLSEVNARNLNGTPEVTGCKYELIKDTVKSEKRIKLEKDATELGVNFRDNIGDKKLEEKINEKLSE